MAAPATVASRKGNEFLLSECYVSVQGESSLVGLPTIFVRLYTCNLRCRWCDSMHAVEGGDFTRIGVDATVKKILGLAGDLESDARGIRNVCWTGGEPLLQGESIARAIERLPETFVHSIETDDETPRPARARSRTARVVDPRGALARSAPAPASQGDLARPGARNLVGAVALNAERTHDTGGLSSSGAFGRLVRYEEIEHTADVGIRAYGATLDELFANAAEGMFSLVADLGSVKAVGEIEVRLEAEDLPTLLLRWLSELLYIHETQRLLFASFEVHAEGTSLRGRARGEAIDKTRHELKLVIKAVTRHRLTVDPRQGIAEVIFDI